MFSVASSYSSAPLSSTHTSTYARTNLSQTLVLFTSCFRRLCESLDEIVFELTARNAFMEIYLQYFVSSIRAVSVCLLERV